MKAPIWRRALLQCLLLPAAALSLPSAQDAAADSRPLGSEGAVSKTRDWGSLLLSGGAFITGVGALGLNWRNTQRIANMESAALERDRQIHTLSQSATAYTEQLDTLANRIAELQQKASAGDTAVAAHAQELQALRGQYADVAERLRTAERGLTRIWNARTTAQWVRQQAQFPDAAAARRQAVQLFTEAHNRRSLHQRGQLLQAFRVINGKLPPGVWEEFPGLGECIRSKLESLGFRLTRTHTDVPTSAWSTASAYCVDLLGLPATVARRLAITEGTIKLIADPEHPAPSLPDEWDTETPPYGQDSHRQFSASPRPSHDTTGQPLWRAALQHISKRPRPSDSTAFLGRSSGVPPRGFRRAPALPFGLSKPIKG